MLEDKKYPLYPELAEAGKQEAQFLIDSFKEKIKKAAEEVIQGFYCDIVPFVETDSWSNFRNQIMDGFRNYDNRKIQGKYDFRQIKKEIFKDFRDEIMKEMPEELIEENESLKRQLKNVLESRHC